MSGTPADVDAVVVEPVRGVHWEIGPLEDYLDADPETRLALQRHIFIRRAFEVVRAHHRRFLAPHPAQAHVTCNAGEPC